MAIPDSHRESTRQHRRAVYASEAAGFALIALVLLLLVLVRYWHNFHWSLR